MRYNNTFNNGGGQAKLYYPNQAAVTEVVLETTGMTAEQETGGVVQNTVPKDGGNTFKVYFLTNGTNEHFQNSNLSDFLRSRGLTTVSKVRNVYDLSGGVGGPIKRDKLWFYAATRWWGNQEYYAGIFYNKTQGSMVYTPDFDRPGYSQNYQRDTSLRLTWQAAAKHKITLSHSVQRSCQCAFNSGFSAPEAAQRWYAVPVYLAMATWTYPATNKLLFEAGVARMHNRMAGQLQPGVKTTDIPILELSRNFSYNAVQGTPSWAGLTLNRPGNDFSQHNERYSVSYITGSHAFKAGLMTLWGVDNFPYAGNPDSPVAYRFNFGVPIQLVQLASPGGALQSMRNIGAYAQDQWTMRKLTLNLGLRFDSFNGHMPDQDRPGGRFVPVLHTARINNVPDFTDLSPRLGAAYDLFGNGKTAIKFSLGRYVAALGGEFMLGLNPANSLVQTSTRSWTDANGNFTPDCVLENVAPNGECGRLDNQAFGTVVVTTHYAPDAISGFGNREYTWQSALSLQHELRPGFGVTAGYFRSWFGNFTVADNLLVTPDDYEPFCVTAPVDPRLPGGGGYQICDGLADIKPSKFGVVDNLVTLWSSSSERGYGNRFKKPREVYDGVDLTFNARWGGGKLLQGGMNVGRSLRDCWGGIIPSNLPLYSSEQPVQFCESRPPFFLAQYKFAGVYPLPFGLQASATFQSLPGIGLGERANGAGHPATAVNKVYTSAEIKPSLGRDLAAGPRGVYLVNLFTPDKYYEQRLTQLDVRLTKIFRIERARIQGMFDIYNLLNDDSPLIQNLRFGPSYLQPSQVLDGRLFKFGVQLDF